MFIQNVHMYIDHEICNNIKLSITKSIYTRKNNKVIVCNKFEHMQIKNTCISVASLRSSYMLFCTKFSGFWWFFFLNWFSRFLFLFSSRLNWLLFHLFSHHLFLLLVFSHHSFSPLKPLPLSLRQ